MKDKHRAALTAMVPDAAKKFQPYYVAADWKWHVKDGQSVPPYVPTEADLATTLLRMIETSGKCLTSSTGGLTVWAEEHEIGISFEDDLSVDVRDRQAAE